MPSKVWRELQERKAQREADELRRQAARAADWQELRTVFLSRLKALGSPPTITFRDYTVRHWYQPEEHAWWPTEEASHIEAELFEADRRRDVRQVHLHGGRPQGNAALRTLRLLDRAEEVGGEEAKLAMLIRALLHNREPSGFYLDPTDVRARASQAIRQVHPVMPELDWAAGSKYVLPFVRRGWSGRPASLDDLAGQLAGDAAELLTNWLAVRIRSGSVLPQKSEAA